MYSPTTAKQHLNIFTCRVLALNVEFSGLDFWDFYFLYFAPFRRGNKLFAAEQATQATSNTTTRVKPATCSTSNQPTEGLYS
jgi:hypothetical protein